EGAAPTFFVAVHESLCGPGPSSVYITTCPQLAKAAVRAADEGAGFDPNRTRGSFRLRTCELDQVSSATSLPKSAGEPRSAVAPRSARRAFILGSARVALICLLRLLFR